jgi:hypothetical protein
MEDISTDPPDAIIGWLASRIALAIRRLRLEPRTDWDDFLAHGRDGHPAWHYAADGTGRMALRPMFSGPAKSRLDCAPPQPIVRVTRHDATQSASRSDASRDLLAYLIEHLDIRPVKRRTAGPPIWRPVRSVSLLAREWGTRSGHSQRLADELLRELGDSELLERTRRGSATTWRIPSDAMERLGRSAANHD